MVNHLLVNKFMPLRFFNQRFIYSFSRDAYFRMFQFLPGIVLCQAIEFVEDKINSSVANAITVFIMKDLRCLYQEMLRNLDASEEMIILMSQD